MEPVFCEEQNCGHSSKYCCRARHARAPTNQKTGPFALGDGKLDLRNLRGVPAAAEGFDKENAGDQAASANVDGGSLVAEGGALSGGYFEVVGDATPISAIGKIERVLCGGDRGVLGAGFSIENTQGGQVVLDLLKGSQGCLPVVVHEFVVRRAGFLGDAAAPAAIENQFGRRSRKGPESAGPVEKITYLGALKTARSRDGNGRKIRGARDSDLGIGFLDAAFGGGYIGTALEQFRGQTDRDGRRSIGERQGLLGEFVAGLADQRGNGVLESCALNGDVLGLGASGFKLSLGLGDVHCGGNAALITAASQLERAFVRRDRGVQELLLRVEASELEIIEGKFGM